MTLLLAFLLFGTASAGEMPALGDVEAVLAVARRTASAANPWPMVKAPASGPAEAIGGYAAGCLRGGVELEESGEGFQAMRLSRNRRYGHPDLIDYIRGLGRGVSGTSMGGVLVGDLGQPRGGPTSSSHASHENGLDVDFWFLFTGKRLSRGERETMDAPNMVVRDFERLSGNWDPRVVDFLMIASADERVERVFVNPVIKKAACEAYKGEPWLGKLRPWWGHDDHCHVRLACPTGGSHCKPQEAAPAGDGCDASLEQWFTAETRAEARRKREHPQPSSLPSLPALCREVLNSD